MSTDDDRHPMPGAWHWWAGVGSQPEMYGVGPCASREEAIDEAIGQELVDIGDLFTVMEAQDNHVDLALYFDVDEWLWHVGDRMDDSGEDGSDENGDHHPLEKVTPEQVADLQARVRAAIRKWQRHHQLPLRAFYFKRMRNSEGITRDR